MCFFYKLSITLSQAPAAPPAAPAVEAPQPPAAPQAGPPAAPPAVNLGAQGDAFYHQVGQGGGHHRRWCQYLLCLKGCTEIPKPHCIRCGSAMVIYIDRVDKWFWLGWKCLNCGTSWGKWEVDERLTRLAIDELEWTLPGPRGLGVRFRLRAPSWFVGTQSWIWSRKKGRYVQSVEGPWMPCRAWKGASLNVYGSVGDPCVHIPPQF